MFRSCAFCNAAFDGDGGPSGLGVGRRLAFDEWKGRLWVVCPRCSRWNLTPFDDRLERIEALARVASQGRIAASTDQVALIRWERYDFVRVGKPPRVELATWRYGLGQAAAFTSDAKSRWAAEWLTWPGYSKFWAQVVRNTMRKSDAKGVAVQVDQHGGKATVTLDAVDPSGRFLNQAEAEMTLIDPQLGSRKVPLTQTAPGRYVATLDASKSGAYHMELTQKKNGQVLYRQSRGISVGYSEELRLRPTNETLLRQIAEASGGTYQPTAEAIFAPTERTAHRPTPPRRPPAGDARASTGPG